MCGQRQREIVQFWIEIWKSFKEVAALDLDLDRNPEPNRQMRKRHFKKQSGGNKGVGSWHVTAESALGRKEAGRYACACGRRCGREGGRV